MIESQDGWRSERNADAVLSLVRAHYRPDMNRADAAAILWIARSQLFFDQNLHNEVRVSLQFYDEMVSEPVMVMKRIYEWLELSSPQRAITDIIQTRTLKRGTEIEIDKQIDARCLELQTRLLAAMPKVSVLPQASER